MWGAYGPRRSARTCLADRDRSNHIPRPVASSHPATAQRPAHAIPQRPGQITQPVARFIARSNGVWVIISVAGLYSKANRRAAEAVSGLGRAAWQKQTCFERRHGSLSCRHTEKSGAATRRKCHHISSCIPECYQPKPMLSVKRLHRSITSPVSTTPAAATPPPTPTARKMP